MNMQINWIYGSEKPEPVEMKYVLGLNTYILNVFEEQDDDGGWRWLQQQLPTGILSHEAIVDALIRLYYPTDRMEAVTNNYLSNQGDMASAIAYTEMLRYRGVCKVLSRELLRYCVDNGIVTQEFIDSFDILENTRSLVFQKIQNYDMSDNVNGFILADTQVWLTKPQRESLLTSLNMFVKAGVDTFPFVLGGRAMEMPCAQMEQMLAAVEVYATQCMMVTSQHTAAVSVLETEEAILSYDYTQGYPDKLSFDVGAV